MLSFQNVNSDSGEEEEQEDVSYEKNINRNYGYIWSEQRWIWRRSVRYKKKLIKYHHRYRILRLVP